MMKRMMVMRSCGNRCPLDTSKIVSFNAAILSGSSPFSNLFLSWLAPPSSSLSEEIRRGQGLSMFAPKGLCLGLRLLFYALVGRRGALDVSATTTSPLFLSTHARQQDLGFHSTAKY